MKTLKCLTPEIKQTTIRGGVVMFKNGIATGLYDNEGDLIGPIPLKTLELLTGNPNFEIIEVDERGREIEVVDDSDNESGWVDEEKVIKKKKVLRRKKMKIAV